MKHPVFITSLMVATAAGCGSGDSSGPSGFMWASRAPMPVPRSDFDLVTVGTSVYALGGYSGSTLARVDMYDPAADSWTRKADMLTARRNFVAGVLNGKIYVTAGTSWTDPNAVTYITATEEYDPGTDTWTARAPCPIDPATNSVFGNLHIGGAAANGRLYVVVFNTNTPGLTATYEYDPGTDSWDTKAPGPFSYARLTATELAGQVYVYASAENGSTGRLAQYDPVGDIWILRASLRGIWWPALGSANGRLYSAGGVTVSGTATPTRVVSEVHEYDPTSDSWRVRTGLRTPRRSAEAVEFGGQLYVVGGSSSTDFYQQAPLTTVEAGTLE